MKSSKKSASHQLFKDKAKNRVDDLQGVFTDLQFARKGSRSGDVAVLEEQVHLMLREWKAELNEPSPASSLLVGGSLGTFSQDLCRLLQRCEEDDDATSALKEPGNPKSERDVQSLLPAVDNTNLSHDSYFLNQVPQEDGYLGLDQCKESSLVMHPDMINNLEAVNQFDFHQFDFHQDFDQNLCIAFNGPGQCGESAMQNLSDLPPSMRLPPSAFLGPICALWDCLWPAQGTDWYQDYCSSFHALLAMQEGPPGMTPVVRPAGIGLKDGPLFAALKARAHGKCVGIPECEGAAMTKSPWNAPDLFDLSLVDGETIREWVFFDKPRRAFESGNRKQRSLPDYSGRGWHESRKQQMKEFDGLKRSYYMDPQPLNGFEWHLYEYEITNCDVCALYRLEFKIVDGKKSPKGKVTNDPLADLQKQMGRLSAEVPADNKRYVKGGPKGNTKDINVYLAPNPMAPNPMAPNPMAPSTENLWYGVNASSGYTVELNDYYGT